MRFMCNARERQVALRGVFSILQKCWCCSSARPPKPALARSKRKTYTMGPRHLPHTNNCAAWVLTNTYPGGFRQTCIMSERPESIGPNRPT